MGYTEKPSQSGCFMGFTIREMDTESKFRRARVSRKVLQKWIGRTRAATRAARTTRYAAAGSYGRPLWPPYPAPRGTRLPDRTPYPAEYLGRSTSCKTLRHTRRAPSSARRLYGYVILVIISTSFFDDGSLSVVLARLYLRHASEAAIPA